MIISENSELKKCISIYITMHVFWTPVYSYLMVVMYVEAIKELFRLQYAYHGRAVLRNVWFLRLNKLFRVTILHLWVWSSP